MTEKVTRDLRILHAALQRGEVIAFPTDTVYGLGADAGNADAVRALYAIKGREEKQPLQVLIGSLEQAQLLAEFSPRSLNLAKHFWPGALTLILPKKQTGLLADNVCGKTVGLRWPNQYVLEEYGRPVAASSANKSGEAPLASAEEIAARLPVAAVMPAKGKFSGQASTVLEIREEKLHIFREGAISRAELEHVWNL